MSLPPFPQLEVFFLVTIRISVTCLKTERSHFTITRCHFNECDLFMKKIRTKEEKNIEKILYFIDLSKWN